MPSVKRPSTHWTRKRFWWLLFPSPIPPKGKRLQCTGMNADFPRRLVRPTAGGVLRRWTRAEVYALFNSGFFHPEQKTELIGGLLYHKPRQSPAHGAAVM